MSWIESHQSLLNHRKTLRATTLLKVDKYKLLGHLHALWWWGLDSANDDGLLGDVTKGELAAAAGWAPKTAIEFVDAIVTAGFVEDTSEGYVLHDWFNYAGKLNDQRDLRRQSNKEAQQRRRQRLRQHDSQQNGQHESSGVSSLPTHPPTNQPPDPISQNGSSSPTGRMPFSEGEVLQILAQFPGTNVNQRWKEYVIWVGASESRRPRKVLPHFIGFLKKGAERNTAAV